MNNPTPPRHQRIADGVIAGYIHDISARHRPSDVVSSRSEFGLASGRVRRRAPMCPLRRPERELIAGDATRAAGVGDVALSRPRAIDIAA
jgi:hypothetical protein